MFPVLGKTTALFAVIVLSFTGCQSPLMLSSNQPEFADTEMIAVQIRPAHGKAKNVEIPLKPNMTLQDVINTTKSNFRNNLAYIVRTSPVTGEKHKLPGKFGSNRRVSLETDYAIQPGDRVVITQDTSTSFDRVMQSLVGRS